MILQILPQFHQLSVQKKPHQYFSFCKNLICPVCQNPGQVQDDSETNKPFPGERNGFIYALSRLVMVIIPIRTRDLSPAIVIKYRPRKIYSEVPNQGARTPGPNLGIIGPTPGHSLMGHILAAQKHRVSSIGSKPHGTGLPTEQRTDTTYFLYMYISRFLCE